MTDQPIVLAGQYGSPYTLKMRGVLRYRRIPFRWVLRDSPWDDLPPPPVALIPVIAYPDGNGGYADVTVDSSPQIMRLETEFAGRSLLPSDPALALIDMLIEDYGDEWLTKAMYHYRWAYQPDIEKAGKLLPLSSNLHLSPERADQAYRFITKRQISRRAMVGSTDETAGALESSYRRVLTIMQAHLEQQQFLLGERPGRGDFGLFGQLTQLVRWDPTPMQVAIDIAPKVVNWVERMDDLAWLPVEGDDGWGALETLPASIHTLLCEIGATYAPFMVANADALARGADEVVCTVAGATGTVEYRQPPFPYQGKCLTWLREAYLALQPDDRVRVDAALAGTGCEQLFARSAAE